MISWSSQLLPSGSLNDARAKYERPGESKPGGRASCTSLTSTPRVIEVVPGGVDVVDDEDHPLSGSRLGRSATLAELDRTSRVRRRQLHRPDVVADDQVDVQPPSEALVEALCPVDVGDGQRHDLEVHVDAEISASRPSHSPLTSVLAISTSVPVRGWSANPRRQKAEPFTGGTAKSIELVKNQ